jgi:amino acid adenylation domain-containing protein
MNKDISRNILVSSQQLAKEKDYWMEKLSGELAPCIFPYDYIQPEVSQSRYETLPLKIPSEISSWLTNVSNGSDIRLFMIIVTITKIILYKYTGKTDVIICTPTYKQEVEGELLNYVLILRDQINEGATFKELLFQVRQIINEADENQNYPIQQLINILDSKNHSKIADTIFDNLVMLENIHEKKEIEDIHPNLIINFIRHDYGIKGEINYNPSLYKQETLERINNHFITGMESILNNPDIQIKEIEIISQRERQQICNEFNNTKSQYPKNKTIHQLFEEQVARTPDNDAVIYEEYTLTYRQLNEKANQLAWLLREKGVKPDHIVAIMVERSLEMIIGILGILKAGAAYLPIDPNFPQERVRTILQDSSTLIVLTCQAVYDKNPFTYREHVIINQLLDGRYSSTNPPIKNNPNDLIYVIYTSGSTGKPKGVLIEHQSVINRLNWMQKNYPITEADTILQKTTYTFDVSVWEIFWWSLQGAKVCLLPPDGEKDPNTIISRVQKNQVTTIHFVPSMLNVFLDYLENQSNLDGLSSLRQVFCSGEALPPQYVNRFYKILLRHNAEAKLYNLYGPTEATVDVSYYNCSSSKASEVIPIGKPIDNTKLYIFNKDNQLQPVGIPGELYIAGDGLARGYINQPELTGEKFVMNPYQPEERMYRTGDLACWLLDGNIEFLGRIDHQVKIHGYRIELGEIESQLLQYETIIEAVVSDWTDLWGTKYLCAYIVAPSELNIPKLQEHLKKYLPHYMIPAYFIQLEKMPLTANGKIDRKALPNPKENYQAYDQQEFWEPKDEFEKKLAALWREILGIERVNTQHNFFDIGGNSILVIKLYSRLEQEFPGELITTDIFAYPTIVKLAEYIRKKQEEFQSKQIPVSGTPLPSDYFNPSISGNKATEYQFQIENELLIKLQNIAKEYEIEMVQVLLGLYIYLFAELSGKTNIHIQTMVNSTNRVYPISIDLDGIEEYQQLFERVGQTQHEEIERNNYYHIKEIGQIIPKKYDFSVVPFFYDRQLLETGINLLTLYDVVFEVDLSSPAISFRCEYNADKLHGEKIEELVQGYLKLVQLAVL